jgi:hypothetical protein
MIPRLPRGFSHPMRIGEGAFASVYRVRQQTLDRWVAVKIVAERNRARRGQLLREARTQARIKSECIPQIYDAFEWNNNVCIVMQWIRGIPLSALIESPLSGQERFDLTGGFLQALASLHSLGFAHRDLKPANILISPEKGFYLVDFGFARDTADGERSVALTAKGTPAYMAPEIWRHGGNVELMRADVFSAGKVLRLLLNGTHAMSFTDKLLEEDPALRPASGIEVLEAWNKAQSLPPALPGFETIAGRRVSALMSVKLTLASKELLFAGRNEEAYWLLVESLEENAENAEALELMSRFPRRARKTLRLVASFFAAAAIIAALAGAFLVGKESAGGSGPLPFSSQVKLRSTLSINDETGPFGTIPLKEDSLKTGMLSGLIAVDRSLPGCVLYIDNIACVDTVELRNGIRLPKGEHDLSLVDSSGNRCWHRRVNLLPFQKKIISIEYGNDREK